MSRLWSIAVIIWSVGLVIAVLSAPLWFGWDFSFGPVLAAVSPFVSVSGAIAALWIATTDRRDRERKEDAADEAKAKLVILSADRPLARGQLRVLVRNLGSDPMVDLTFVGLDVEGHKFDLIPFRHKWFPVLAPTEQKIFVVGLPGNGQAFRHALKGYHDPPAPAVGPPPANSVWFPPTIGSETTLTATIRFTDQRGNVWQRSASNRAVTEDRIDESLVFGPVQRVG